MSSCWVTIATSFSHNTSSQFSKVRRFGLVAPAIFKYAAEKENANLFSTGTLPRTIWKVWRVVALKLWERHVRYRCQCLCIKRRVSSVTNEARRRGKHQKRNNKVTMERPRSDLHRRNVPHSEHTRKGTYFVRQEQTLRHVSCRGPCDHPST